MRVKARSLAQSCVEVVSWQPLPWLPTIEVAPFPQSPVQHRRPWQPNNPVQHGRRHLSALHFFFSALTASVVPRAGHQLDKRAPGKAARKALRKTIAHVSALRLQAEIAGDGRLTSYPAEGRQAPQLHHCLAGSSHGGHRGRASCLPQVRPLYIDVRRRQRLKACCDCAVRLCPGLCART